jgi:hypothetical protein
MATEKIIFPSTKFFQTYFGTSNAVRNSVLITVLGAVGLILLGALGGPLAPALLVFLLVGSGVVAVAGILGMVTSGILAYFNFMHDCKNFKKYTEKYDFNGTSMVAYLRFELIEWMKCHKIDTFVGSLLFLVTLALIVFAVFFPPILTGIFPFLSTAIGFVSSGLVGMGLVGISASVMAFLSASIIGIAAITAWDVLCRIGYAAFSVDQGLTSTEKRDDEYPTPSTDQGLTSTEKRDDEYPMPSTDQGLTSTEKRDDGYPMPSTYSNNYPGDFLSNVPVSSTGPSNKFLKFFSGNTEGQGGDGKTTSASSTGEEITEEEGDNLKL